MAIDFTRHALTVIADRGIQKQWIQRAVEAPERSEEREDGTRHLLLRIPERDGRVLRVVVDGQAEPWKVITAFFDRRLSGGVP